MIFALIGFAAESLLQRAAEVEPVEREDHVGLAISFFASPARRLPGGAACRR